MKKFTTVFLIALSLGINAQSLDTIEKSKIEKLIYEYEVALNSSNVAKVMEGYATDGVFIPSAAPTSVGKEQIAEAYNHVFSTIIPNLHFKILEVTVIDFNHAIVRSESLGTVVLKLNNQVIPDKNRELFYLEKEKKSWKIARYMFNKTN